MVFSPIAHAFSTNEFIAGPLFSDFKLTLDSGYRQEAVGPLFYTQEVDSQTQIGLPPFFCWTRTRDVDWSETDFLYPLLTYRRFGSEGGLQIMQFFSRGGGENQVEARSKRFTIFPIYFQSRSAETNLNYTALVPFYGNLRNRLFHDRIHFVMFPIYAHTVKKDIVTDNYVYPIVHTRHGDALTGWQVWPFVGAEHKGLTFKTNTLDEVEPIGGYDKSFVLFPFFLKSRTGLSTTNLQTNLTVIPFFNSSHSATRDMTCYGWPLGYNVIHDPEKRYDERDFIWPLWVFAHGSKQETRIFPFYSHAKNENLESDFYLWPIYKFNRLLSPPLDRTRTRIALFLYSDIHQKNTETGDVMRRADLWPLYTYRHDIDGTERLQILALLEPLFPNNRVIPREYSPIWSLWRAEKNHKTGADSQSLLWNLYRREHTHDRKTVSLLFGLIQREKTPTGATWRLFYLPRFQNLIAKGRFNR
ncbi:MAG TPA: hypothetical protein VHB20_09615 [Verrucomicrobiae bacterium]|nr:hypothetical protein [Verrucomicrobiae bacterium]